MNGIINANSTINGKVITSYITSGVTLSLTNYSTAAYVDLCDLVSPSLPAGSSSLMTLGVSPTAYNNAVIQFNYNGARSQTNTLGYGFYGSNNLVYINAYRDTTISGRLTVGGANIWNKKLVFHDSNPGGSVVSDTNVFGFDINS